MTMREGNNEIRSGTGEGRRRARQTEREARQRQWGVRSLGGDAMEWWQEGSIALHALL